MGCVSTINYENFPKQKDKEYKYPSIGKRVKVCYNYDTSKTHLGIIVRDDIENLLKQLLNLIMVDI